MPQVDALTASTSWRVAACSPRASESASDRHVLTVRDRARHRLGHRRVHVGDCVLRAACVRGEESRPVKALEYIARKQAKAGKRPSRAVLAKELRDKHIAVMRDQLQLRRLERKRAELVAQLEKQR